MISEALRILGGAGLDQHQKSQSYDPNICGLQELEVQLDIQDDQGDPELCRSQGLCFSHIANLPSKKSVTSSKLPTLAATQFSAEAFTKVCCHLPGATRPWTAAAAVKSDFGNGFYIDGYLVSFIGDLVPYPQNCFVCLLPTQPHFQTLITDVQMLQLVQE